MVQVTAAQYVRAKRRSGFFDLTIHIIGETTMNETHDITISEMLWAAFAPDYLVREREEYEAVLAEVKWADYDEKPEEGDADFDL